MATVKVGKGRGNFKIPVDKNCPDGYNIQALKLHMRECWNGRQARLRCVCPMACEFESHLPHQKNHGSKCDKHGETWFFLFIHAKIVWCFVSWIPVWVLFGCYGLKNRESASYMDAKQQPAPALGAGFSASMGLCAAGSRRLLCK